MNPPPDNKKLSAEVLLREFTIRYEKLSSFNFYDMAGDAIQFALDSRDIEIKELEARVEHLVEVINAVQNKIFLISNKSDGILAPVNEAWNLNAGALSKEWKEQNNFLSKCDQLRKANEINRNLANHNADLTHQLAHVSECLVESAGLFETLMGRESLSRVAILNIGIMIATLKAAAGIGK